MDNPFDIERHREAIDAHKADRMADPWKSHAYQTINRHTCVRFWIQQIGDAELYEQRYHELTDLES